MYVPAAKLHLVSLWPRPLTSESELENLFSNGHPLTYEWISVPSFIEIPPLSTEISHHAKWVLTDGRADGPTRPTTRKLHCGSIKHKATKFACSREFSDTADRMVWPPSLSGDQKWSHVTKCTHSRVVGLRLEGNLVLPICLSVNCCTCHAAWVKLIK